MTDWHPDSDQWVALALADLDQVEQEGLLAHLAGCPTCRDEYASVWDGTQQALAATPAIAPAGGFSGRVLAAMNPTPQPGPTAPRHPRTVLLVAAALLLGLLTGIGGTIATMTWIAVPSQTGAALEPGATTLVTREGDSVGSAGIATKDGRSYLLLNITAGRPGATYECILIGPNGERTSGGRWTLTGEYGPGKASGSWLVPITGEPPVAVELVAASGAVWSRAHF